ncbi:carbonic anhydrase [Streptomyces phaeoluteigriseus]|uniref:Carbonic anhydrase n=1 Tax=Streptomyces phaeoluteigriseus TaxID=114686 RepID=A0ABY4ZJE6_9ACTN|nr:carbonic anhydrase [Streptomyces phaeoluteigriseus]USQ89139.1 carbonic anhydrase [Streptomyces phaeoluteigriseus]
MIPDVDDTPLPTPARRTLLRGGLVGAVALGGAALTASAASATPTAPAASRPTTAAAALRELAAGNRRWRTFRERHPDESPTVRQSLTQGQHPYAVVLGCIDSRVPPELVFDQGLGDLMTVRTAGEVLDEAVLGSVAYGVLELGIPLVLVLGHQSCGAVRAAVEADLSGERLPAHIQYLADQIRPVIDRGEEGDARIDATIDANVLAVRSRLAAEPDLAAKITAGKLVVAGARYELTTQTVHRLA